VKAPLTRAYALIARRKINDLPVSTESEQTRPQSLSPHVVVVAGIEDRGVTHRIAASWIVAFYLSGSFVLRNTGSCNLLPFAAGPNCRR